MSEHHETHEPHILIVEDDASARLSLLHVITRAGYRVSHVTDGEQAIALLAHGTPAALDVVVTDLLLRDIDGVQVLKVARGLPTPPEVILLTGFGTLQTAIAALRYGAFDYLLTPCQPAELLQRLARAVERRHQRIQAETATAAVPPYPNLSPAPESAAPPIIQIGELRIVPRRQAVWLRDEAVHLTTTEYKLLLVLLDVPGHVVSYEELVWRVYHQDPAEHAHRLLKTHMYNLRQKLPRGYIRNRRSVGYWFTDPNSPSIDH